MSFERNLERLKEINKKGTEITYCVIITETGGEYTEKGQIYVEDSLKKLFGLNTKRLAFMQGEFMNNPKNFLEFIKSNKNTYVVLSSEPMVFIAPFEMPRLIAAAENAIEDHISVWRLLRIITQQESISENNVEKETSAPNYDQLGYDWISSIE